LVLVGNEATGEKMAPKQETNVGCAIVIMTGKKVLVVCLAGARSLLRPDKKKIQLSVWRVRDQ
jgi:hypothetical protein